MVTEWGTGTAKLVASSCGLRATAERRRAFEEEEGDGGEGEEGGVGDGLPAADDAGEEEGEDDEAAKDHAGEEGLIGGGQAERGADEHRELDVAGGRSCGAGR